MTERTSQQAAEVEIDWDRSAFEYARSLTLEQLMESVPQATQRGIFLAAFHIVHAARPDIQPFNELLVQWVREGQHEVGKVVPDNMVVLWSRPIDAVTSYIVPKQPTGPFWVLEYQSKSNQRKDYEESFAKYEKELKPRYYLIFHPEEQELTLFRHNGTNYLTLAPNEAGRLAIPELDIEMGLLDGWVRFWFRGKLLPMPAEMQQQLNEAKQSLNETKHTLDQTQHTLDHTKHTLDMRTQERDEALAELARLREEMTRLRGQP